MIMWRSVNFTAWLMKDNFINKKWFGSSMVHSKIFLIPHNPFYLIINCWNLQQSQNHFLQSTHPSISGLESPGMWPSLLFGFLPLLIKYNDNNEPHLSHSLSKKYAFGFTLSSSIRKKLGWPAKNLKWWFCTLLQFWNPANF